MKRFLILGLGLLLVLPLAQAGKLYKWVDRDGKVHYTDRAPPSSAGKVEERVIGSEPEDSAEAALEEAVAKYPITLYSVPKCSTCDLARLYLTKHKLPFTEKNVSAGNDANQKEMIKKIGELVVPTIAVGERVMKGAYVESLLESELQMAGYLKKEPPEQKTEESSAPPGGAEAAPPAAPAPAQ